MKKHIGWSYAPYKPFFTDVGDIYICRVVPYENFIHIEWLENVGICEIFVKERENDKFALVGTSDTKAFDIKDLKCDTDYEFFVRSGDKNSKVRIARCGKSVGNIVNYLHPEDEAYKFSGKYLCSPSMVRHPDGYLLASMDLFAGGFPQNLTLIFRSDDDGESWHYVSELFPCFWGKMFIYQDALYMLSVSTEYGDLLIGRSDDGGVTFTEPVVLLRGSGGKNGETGVHKNPQPLFEYEGRLWGTLEWGAWGSGYHAPMVMSAPLGSDLLDPESWSYSEPVKYDPNWIGVPKGESAGNIEGQLVLIDGELHNIMRYQMNKLERKYGLIVDYKVNADDPDAPLEYVRCIEYPCNNSKFTVKFDPVSGKYISIGSRIYDPEKIGARNLLSLLVSDNCLDWKVAHDILDYRDHDYKKVGFQYVDMMFEGDDLIFLCRTALNGADSFHNSNYSTFHRIKNFRNLI